MAVPALRFSSLRPSEACRSSLPDDSTDSLLELRALVGPCAFVVRSVELGSLRRLGQGIVDRGRKHPAKGLAPTLLGCDEVPIIEGSYRVPGRLVQGVRSLLEGAHRRGDANLFVIGVDKGLFEALWSRSAEETDSGAGAAGAEFRAASDAEPLLGLLIPRKEPPELARRFVGTSEQARLVRQLVLIAADHDDPVLVLGDTGTGKEVVARAIHDYSDRRTETFAPVNCGAIPRELLESELYGHERGAFTGAHRRKIGLWRAADRGTIFLDEIGDLPQDQQVKILRAIDHGTVRPVGSESEVRAAPRVIAATNRDLWAMVQAGEFREDLYYRLRAFLIRTPVLRRHPSDIPLLAQHFWSHITHDTKSHLPRPVLERLEAYRWPGNARELKSVLASLHALFGQQELGLRHLRAVFRLEGRPAPRQASPVPETEIDLHRIECFKHLRRVDEVLLAIEIGLRPLAGRKIPPAAESNRIRTSLRHLTSELGLLCSRPLLFHSPETYAAVRNLADRVEGLDALLGSDRREARAAWRGEGRLELARAREAVMESVESLVNH